MYRDVNIREYLHEVLANKAKARLTLEQFDKILGMADQIQKISQKGLLIVALSDELHKISNVNYKSIQKFMNDFIKGLKPQKPRKQPTERQHVRRRRRSKPADTTNVVRSVDQIAEESLSNPSNLQVPRLGQNGSSQQEQSQKTSQNLSKKSQQLPKQTLKDLQYANELQKISQGIQFGGGISDEQYHVMEPIEQLSKASSSQSFGVVSNFSQKMALLGKKQIEQKRTVKKGQIIMTKKKLPHGLMVDKSLRLEKTKATMNESFSTEQKSIQFECSQSLQLYYENSLYHNDAFDQFIAEIQQNTAAKLQNFLYSLRKLEQFRSTEGFFETDFTQFDTGQYGDQIIDFTSQQMPPSYIENNFGIEQMSIFRRETQNPTISSISQKLNQPPAVIFFEMLLKMQKGQIVMSQENPSQFGQIKLELIQAE